MPPASTTTDPFIFLIPGGLALVFVIFGGVMAAIGSYRAGRDAASGSWPTVEAIVTDSGRSSYRAPGESSPQLRSHVSYQYEVQGLKYEFRTSASEVGELPKPGTTVPLRYDPEDPADTRLPNQEPFPATLFYVIGAGAVIITLPFWYLSLRWYRAARAG